MTAGDRGSYRDAVARLGSAQKRAKGGPAYTIYVNRWIGGRIAALAYVRGLTPDAVTAVSAVLSLLGIAVLALADRTAVLAAPLLLAGYALDSADGQLARLRGGGSAVGEWLDHLVDAIKVTSLHLAVLIHLHRFTDLADPWLLVPIGFTVSNTTTYFAYLLNDLLRRGRSSAGTASLAAYEPASPVNALLKLPLDYGVLCVAFLLVGSPVLFLVAYGALFAANAAFLLAAVGKWFRDLQRLDQAQP